MVKKETVLLLSFAMKGAQGECAAQLAKKFSAAVGETKETKKLRRFLDNYEYYGETGRSLVTEGNALLADTFSQWNNFAQNSKKITYLINRIEEKIRNDMNKIESPKIFATDIIVLKKDLTQSVRDLYTAILDSACYEALCMSGIDSLSGIDVDLGGNTSAFVHNVNEAVYAILKSMPKKNNSYWKMYPVSISGKNAIHYSGYDIEFSNKPFPVNQDAIRHTPYICEYKENGRSVLAGQGNITNLTPQNGSDVLGSEIITKPSSKIMDNARPPRGLYTFLTEAFHGSFFALTPQTAVNMINRCIMTSEIGRRISEGRCLICGKSGDMCEHFRIERDFEKRGI